MAKKKQELCMFCDSSPCECEPKKEKKKRTPKPKEVKISEKEKGLPESPGGSAEVKEATAEPDQSPEWGASKRGKRGMGRRAVSSILDRGPAEQPGGSHVRRGRASATSRLRSKDVSLFRAERTFFELGLLDGRPDYFTEPNVTGKLLGSRDGQEGEVEDEAERGSKD